MASGAAARAINHLLPRDAAQIVFKMIHEMKMSGVRGSIEGLQSDLEKTVEGSSGLCMHQIAEQVSPECCRWSVLRARPHSVTVIIRGNDDDRYFMASQAADGESHLNPYRYLTLIEFAAEKTETHREIRVERYYCVSDQKITTEWNDLEDHAECLGMCREMSPHAYADFGEALRGTFNDWIARDLSQFFGEPVILDETYCSEKRWRDGWCTVSAVLRAVTIATEPTCDVCGIANDDHAERWTINEDASYGR
jgi:hypothetical protein